MDECLRERKLDVIIASMITTSLTIVFHRPLPWNQHVYVTFEFGIIYRVGDMVGENRKVVNSNHHEVTISCVIEDDSVATSNQGRSSIRCDGLFNNTYCGETHVNDM